MCANVCRWTVFPDWTHPNTSTWWQEEIIEWLGDINIGGLWVRTHVTNGPYGVNIKCRWT